MIDHDAEVFLQPGQFHFGSRGRIGTLLGSCVAITAWHPVMRIGGMCHFMLPARPRPVAAGQVRPALDGRYADEAMALFHRAFKRTGTASEDYRVSIYGGGRQLGHGPVFDIPRRNVEAGLALLDRHGLPVTEHHLAGTGSRRIWLDLGTGRVQVHHQRIDRPLEVS